MTNDEKLKKLNSDLEVIQRDVDASDVEWELKERLALYRGDDRVISFKDYQKEFKDYNKKGLASGLGKLDELVEGFHRGDLITVTAPTGMGKTSFCQFLTSNFSKVGVKSLWFSYEVPVVKLLQKFGENIPEGYTPKILTDRKMIWIETRIIEAIAKYNTSVVFIDHLHYLFDMSFAKNASLAIGDIMRDLKILAKKYNVVIFIIAHTTKIGENDIVSLNSLRDSSFVGQESDYVIALWRVQKKQNLSDKQEFGIVYEDSTVISVVKNRYTGSLGAFKTKYEVSTNNYSTNLVDYDQSDLS